MMFLLRSVGYQISGETEGADIVLLNTCGFIESAKAEAIETILELAAAKEDGRIGKLIVAGCLPERHKEDILDELPEIDAVVGTGSFDDIVNVVGSLLNNQEDSSCLPDRQTGRMTGENSFFGDINAPVSETPRIISTSPAWAYLKIAEGCDNRCAYCCIPDIRGKFRSRPMENIISEATKLAESGIRELIIVAQDTTMYGKQGDGSSALHASKRTVPLLANLLKALNAIEKLKWIRLHYLYPDGFDDELIDVIAKSGKIVKYLDIPIQHINDGILKKMNRRGSSKDIKSLLKRLREHIPNVVIRTSLITGLPGEGEDEFNELCDFLQEAKIERAGVFAYSPEEGTPAALMARPPKEVAEQRAEQLLDLQSQIMHEWNESRIGTTATVLVEGPLEENPFPKSQNHAHYIARSYAESPEIDGYIRINATSKKPPPPCNTFVDIRITGIENGILVGEPI